MISHQAFAISALLIPLSAAPTPELALPPAVLDLTLEDVSRADAQGTETPLQGTDWRLTELGGKPITAADSQAGPSLMFQANPMRFSGSSGCNRIAGTYHLDGTTITFGPSVGTKMACATGMELEAAFISALAKVKTWRVLGRTLELLDAKGKVVARFDAREATN